MDETIARLLSPFDRSVPDWARLMLRLVVAAVVLKPAVSKFLTYERSVAFFSRIGIPLPTVLVVVVGIIQITAVVLLVLGVGERLAALSLVPVMFVAIVSVGPDWKNLTVLGGSLAILVLWSRTESNPILLDRVRS